jgi:hypothetical protein
VCLEHGALETRLAEEGSSQGCVGPVQASRPSPTSAPTPLPSLPQARCRGGERAPAETAQGKLNDQMTPRSSRQQPAVSSRRTPPPPRLCRSGGQKTPGRANRLAEEGDSRAHEGLLLGARESGGLSAHPRPAVGTFPQPAAGSSAQARPATAGSGDGPRPLRGRKPSCALHRDCVAV